MGSCDYNGGRPRGSIAARERRRIPTYMCRIDKATTHLSVVPNIQEGRYIEY